jgi:hypothetical protein
LLNSKTHLDFQKHFQSCFCVNDAHEKEKKFDRPPKSAKEGERRTGKTNRNCEWQ